VINEPILNEPGREYAFLDVRIFAKAGAASTKMLLMVKVPKQLLKRLTEPFILVDVTVVKSPWSRPTIQSIRWPWEEAN
jgi:hypothetical protein